MRVDDETWLRCFGTAESQLEPAPKLGKLKPTQAQLAARMVLDAKEALGTRNPDLSVRRSKHGADGRR